ncbi:uncharacterized protein LOC116613810 [Nematostella vectensis]|uniref:uncharacterized protein LOC116613810 n=1 Tax=Nematostella vectensis TaxID=45351 RepID=UPI0020778BA4|nr:uncharacterized protein LOC116613810 [Nematostella vectensis]
MAERLAGGVLASCSAGCCRGSLCNVGDAIPSQPTTDASTFDPTTHPPSKAMLAVFPRDSTGATLLEQLVYSTTIQKMLPWCYNNTLLLETAFFVAASANIFISFLGILWERRGKFTRPSLLSSTQEPCHLERNQ